MKSLNLVNPHFITYSDDLFSIDVLGGVDISIVENVICTLRISYKEFPPMRCTIDLYNDTETDKLCRNLCTKYSLNLLEVSKTITKLTAELEEYKLSELKNIGKKKTTPINHIGEAQRSQAISCLKDKNLVKNISEKLQTIGIVGDTENSILLFLALASHKYQNPFSVLCVDKTRIGKNYLLQKFSECLPQNSFSIHTQISENALYYFNSEDLHQKVLFIEDMEFTAEMLNPLTNLHTKGKLLKTRAVKNANGFIHTHTFEVCAKPCIVACVSNMYKTTEIQIPFLVIHLNENQHQENALLEYQKKYNAGFISELEIKETKYQLSAILSVLENIKIKNPYASYITLPQGILSGRNTILLVLHTIEICTFLFQFQRKKMTDKATGEVFIESTLEDVQLAFSLLKNNLLHKADELSIAARAFYDWLVVFLSENNISQFTTLQIRQNKTINPRTLNNYLAELKLFQYIQIIGGNKHRGGFIYKIIELKYQIELKQEIETALENNLKTMSKQVRKTTLSNSQTQS